MFIVFLYFYIFHICEMNMYKVSKSGNKKSDIFKNRLKYLQKKKCLSLLNKYVSNEKICCELSGSGRRILLSFDSQNAETTTASGCSSNLGTKGPHLYSFEIKVFYKYLGSKTSKRSSQMMSFEDSLTRSCQCSIPRSQI